jgi:hypothetical protein
MKQVDPNLNQNPNLSKLLVDDDGYNFTEKGFLGILHQIIKD